MIPLVNDVPCILATHAIVLDVPQLLDLPCLLS